jgi:NAD(P)-dependent dehydrogenase (short-subunit alcohol dehydrogenase family)
VEIEGLTALVTGAGLRVGAVIATALAHRGANVGVHYNRSREAAETVAARVRELGRTAWLVSVDQAQWPAIEQACRELWDATGGIDVLVNSAAIFPRTPFEEITEADWDLVLDVNLKGPFAFARCLGLRMKARGRGKIINIGDTLGERIVPTLLPYGIAKAGVAAMTRGLARALAPEVQVNAIEPGAVLFPEGASEEHKIAVLKRIPLRRVGSPDDIARAVLFFIENDYVTGTVLPVDGGQLTL